MEDAIVEYGTDIDSSYSFKDGDLQLVSYKDNLQQAIMNRLNTLQDSLDLFYVDYGSFLQSYLGWRKTDKTLEFIKVEIDLVVSKDPRVDVFSSEVKYDSEGNVEINLTISYSEFDSFSLNYVLGSEGVVVEV